MTEPDWIQARAAITASWPALTRTMANQPQEQVWRAALAPGNAEVLQASIVALRAKLAESEGGAKITPNLGAIEQAVRQEWRRRKIERGGLPSKPDAPAETVSPAAWEAMRIAEATQFAADAPNDIDLGQRIVEIRTIGPNEQRMIGLLDGSDTRSLDEWWADAFAVVGHIKPGPQSMAEMIGTPKPPVATPPLVDIPEPMSPDEKRAVELCDQRPSPTREEWLAESLEVRAAAQRELQRRKVERADAVLADAGEISTRELA